MRIKDNFGVFLIISSILYLLIIYTILNYLGQSGVGVGFVISIVFGAIIRNASEQ